MKIPFTGEKEGVKMGKLTEASSHIAIEAMVELSPCHTEFLENAVTFREEEELIRKFVASGSLG